MKRAIDAKNLSAQLQYRARGNPPSTLPDSAISNSYPGLEMDFRNAWTRLFAGIELHEGRNFVVGVDADAPPDVQQLADGFLLVRVDTQHVTMPVTGPTTPGGPDVPLSDFAGETSTALEWSNVLAGVLKEFAGRSVDCTFQSLDGKRTVTVALAVRQFFEQVSVAGAQEPAPAIARDLVPPGALTQSLCAPWQYDYRYCACFYWAATRPDYVNVQPRADGTSAGNNWLEKNRTPDSPKVYIADDFVDPRLVSIPELIEDWERLLRFVAAGVDEPTPDPEKPE